jgi:MFS family permease
LPFVVSLILKGVGVSEVGEEIEKVGHHDWVVSRVPFFYGWVMLPVAMLIQIATSPGQTFGVSVFNPFLRESLSLSQSAFSGAYTLGTLLASFPLTYVGALMDRYGLRRTLAVVALIFGLACFWMSQVSGLVTLFVAFLFLRMLGQGAMGLLSANTVAMWFNRRLGFTSGVMSLGIAVAVGGMPALGLWLIDGFGWRWAYAILGVGVWVMVFPVLAIFYRNRPEDVGQVPDGTVRMSEAAQKAEDARSFSLSEAMRTRAYWIGAAAISHWSMIGTGIQFHLVQIFLDRGMTVSDAALAFSVLAGAGACGRLMGGILADRLPLNGLLSVAPAVLACGVFLLLQMKGTGTIMMFGGAMGLGQGLLQSAHTTLWARYYGRVHLGKIRGSLSTITVAASGIGPFAMGFSYDRFGGYSEILWVFLAIMTTMVFVGLLATKPKSNG